MIKLDDNAQPSLHNSSWTSISVSVLLPRILSTEGGLFSSYPLRTVYLLRCLNKYAKRTEFQWSHTATTTTTPSARIGYEIIPNSRPMLQQCLLRTTKTVRFVVHRLILRRCYCCCCCSLWAVRRRRALNMEPSRVSLCWRQMSLQSAAYNRGRFDWFENK